MVLKVVAVMRLRMAGPELCGENGQVLVGRVEGQARFINWMCGVSG